MIASDYDAFLGHARAIAERFERRRREFLHRLKFRSAVALLLLVTFPLWFSLLRRIDYIQDGVLSSLSWFVIHSFAGAVIIAGIIAYAIIPLFRYRHYTVQFGSSVPGVSGVGQQTISLKGEIFSELFRYFGDFSLYGDRRLSMRGFRNAPNVPEFDALTGEDYIRGTINSISIEMMETHATVQRSTGAMPLFDGMFIVFDIDSPNRVLRGKFSGKTVVIASHGQNINYIVSKYDTYQPLILPDKRFLAFTTDTDEAKRLLSEDLLQQLHTLSDTVRNARQQVQHVDDRVAYAISSITSGISDVMALAATGLVNWFKTGSLKSSTRPTMEVQETPVPSEAKAFNEFVQCAFYDDKVLVTIPHRNNLFEPDPIFRSPLRDDDIQLVYNLMTMIKGVADAIVSKLPKEMV